MDSKVRLLVLGGTHFVGRALVSEAVARGWEVTVLNRGASGGLPDDVLFLRADRTVAGAVARVVGDRRWDFAVDTWSFAPRAATETALALKGRVSRYAYVSSISVYEWGRHVNEDSPVVAGDPASDEGEYPGMKRGAELGILRSFPEALLARCGLILGPHEDVGRLTWWLSRVAEGGAVVAPGRPRRPLQFVDARDLASWLLTGLEDRVLGPVDVASRSGHATMAEMLDACIKVTGSDARLVWVDEATLDRAGAEPWSGLPCWVPEAGTFMGFLEADTGRAAETGLVCRPVMDTVADTWRWLQQDGSPVLRPDRDKCGLPRPLEAAILAQMSGR